MGIYKATADQILGRLFNFFVG